MKFHVKCRRGNKKNAGNCLSSSRVESASTSISWKFYPSAVCLYHNQIGSGRRRGNRSIALKDVLHPLPPANPPAKRQRLFWHSPIKLKGQWRHCSKSRCFATLSPGKSQDFFFGIHLPNCRANDDVFEMDRYFFCQIEYYFDEWWDIPIEPLF